jgi:hypothetical protein
MWICLSDAFVSIVAHREEPDALMVRARRAGDLERVFPGCEVTRTPRADYLFRATIPREDVAAALAREALRIGYPNFKDSVPDDALHSAYSGFWASMERLQQARRPLEPYQVKRSRPPRRGAATG